MTIKQDLAPEDDAQSVSEAIETEGLEPYRLGESVLAKDWLRPEEEEAWKDL